MPGFTSPGLFFIGTVVPKEMWYLKRVFEGARRAGYTRFVEPAAGAFAMCGIARTVGWAPEQMDATDVALLSAILGAAANGERVDALEIQVKDPEVEALGLDLGDPAQALYAQMLCRYLVKAARTMYWREIVTDLITRKDAVLTDLTAQLGRLTSTLKGFRYRPLCLYAHLAEVLDDPQTFVTLNPPTHRLGWERFYHTGGRLTWKEPTYAFFNPHTDMVKLAAMIREAKALVLLYEEVGFGQSVLPAVFARGGAMKDKSDTGGVRSMATYLSSNRPDEIEALAAGRKIARREPENVRPTNLPILPSTYEPTDASKVALVSLDAGQSAYYRQLWTHRFLGAVTPMNGLGLVVDGYLAGIFAYTRLGLDMGAFGKVAKEDALLLQCGVTPRLPGWRLGRLVTKLALSKAVLAQFLDDVALVRVTHIFTMQFTKYPEAKEMRGLMKLQVRQPFTNKWGLKKGFKLRYQAPIEPTTMEEAYAWWIKDERRYRSLKHPSMSSAT